ncbi:MAG: hypothetical protein M0P64_03910 [Candidatus Pacebacteria bacterium]|jgi:hypothetical protein|nr:hypothetical protein [Candidatus Paceibacterota bacterium]
MRKLIIIAVGVLVLVAVLYFVATQKQTNTQPSKQVQNLIAQLSSDVALVDKPQFVKSEEVLTPVLQKIQDDVIALLVAPDAGSAEYYSQLRIKAIGGRHILISQLTVRGSYDEIIDSQTGKVVYIPDAASYTPRYLAFENGREVALYVGYKDIYTYTLGQEGFVLVPNSNLPKGETYHSGEGDFSIVVHETHSKDSITISVFDESKLVHNPHAVPGAMDIMFKELRKETLYF